MNFLSLLNKLKEFNISNLKWECGFTKNEVTIYDNYVVVFAGVMNKSNETQTQRVNVDSTILLLNVIHFMCIQPDLLFL